MLVSAFGTRVQIACCRDHALALVVVCNGAAMKLSLNTPPTRKIAENAHQTCSGVRINQVAPRVVLRYMAWLAWTEYIHRSSAGGRVGALCAPRASSSARAEAN